MSSPHGTQLGFVYRYEPPEAENELTLLLLHGTGGDENDLIQLGRALSSKAGLLSPRGKVIEDGMARFFRRYAPGQFDIDDLKFRTTELAGFIDTSEAAYGFRYDRLVAVGFSNGANIAASLLLLQPRKIAGAILFRPMVPLVPEATPDLSTTPVFIGAGKTDPVVKPEETQRLKKLLEDGGCEVTLHWQNAGHTITLDEIEAARDWLDNRFSALPDVQSS